MELCVLTVYGVTDIHVFLKYLYTATIKCSLKCVLCEFPDIMFLFGI